ncbi:MAG: hypothetical protein OXG78_07475 [Chloroflexi bacterium]|nr:hypothetical protein [Chloroflexota bacterium]
MLLERVLEGNQRAWWLAPTFMMASQVWRDLKAAARGIEGVRISESEHRIDLPGGGMIAVRSSHQPDYLRGEGLDLAVLDEAAYIEPRVWPEIVRPMLTTTRGEALFLSTPRGRNWFWDIYRLGADRKEDEWAAFRFSTADNPRIKRAELESIRRQTSERIWKSEYLAEFNDESGQVFRGIRAAVRPPLYYGPHPDHRYVIGVDWGRSQDYTAIAVIDATTRQMVALDRFNQVGWSLQRGRLRSIAETWRAQVIWAEANSFGSPNIEALQQDGLPMRSFQTSARNKAPLIESLALAIERGYLGLLDDPVLLGELASYSLERLPGGGFRYGAPAGCHDDTVMAAALAWHGAENSGPIIAFV